ncbi:MAG TPA: hypothetical protein VH370_21925 [Humisphaera sp.]|nr:hypothetical protein [Humisphaera sp.]
MNRGRPAIFAATLLAVLCLLPGRHSLSQSMATIGSSRFIAVDVMIDPNGQPLAAYQVQIVQRGAEVTLVGVEGGESTAFAAAPYYDKRAILKQRIVIAAYSTNASLPTTKTRVATLMLQVSGDATPAFTATLQAAGSGNAQRIAATVTTSIAKPSEGARE